jgi:hypothetical protein
MTESEWLALTDPQAMLEFLREGGKLSERKARLFAAACCRWVWHLLVEEADRQAVEIAERFADGQADESELADAKETAEQAAMWGRRGGPAGPLWEAGWYTSMRGGALANAQDPDAPAVLAFAATSAKGEELADLCPPWAVALGVEPKVQECLLRDIFFNPFRPPPKIDPCWLAWDDGTIKRLAEAVYELRLLPSGHLDPARLSVLADALLDAGCPSDHELLLHLRGEGPHVRGCWAVDYLTARS